MQILGVALRKRRMLLTLSYRQINLTTKWERDIKRDKMTHTPPGTPAPSLWTSWQSSVATLAAWLQLHPAKTGSTLQLSSCTSTSFNSNSSGSQNGEFFYLTVTGFAEVRPFLCFILPNAPTPHTTHTQQEVEKATEEIPKVWKAAISTDTLILTTESVKAHQ